MISSSSWPEPGPGFVPRARARARAGSPAVSGSVIAWFRLARSRLEFSRQASARRHMITSSEVVARTIAITPTESKLDHTRIASAPAGKPERQDDPTDAVLLRRRCVRLRQPRRPRGNHRRPVPERVEPLIVRIGVRGDRDQVHAVGDREDDDRRGQQRPGLIEPPVAQSGRADDQAEQQHVAQRVGEVCRDRDRAAGRACKDRPDTTAAHRAATASAAAQRVRDKHSRGRCARPATHQPEDAGEREVDRTPGSPRPPTTAPAGCSDSAASATSQTSPAAQQSAPRPNRTHPRSPWIPRRIKHQTAQREGMSGATPRTGRVPQRRQQGAGELVGDRPCAEQNQQDRYIQRDRGGPSINCRRRPWRGRRALTGHDVLIGGFLTRA